MVMKTDETDIIAAAMVLQYVSNVLSTSRTRRPTYGLIDRPNGEPNPIARATATMLYVIAHAMLIDTCRMVLLEMSSNVSKLVS